MNETPRVSTIIIFKDAEQFFREAIESVLSQTYTHWELLLVDDGSTDSSTQIAREYSARYPRKISYLEHEGHVNLGMSATRNLGIQHARGELIAFLDADDVWLPFKLAEQVSILDAHPEAGMVFGLSLWWYSWTGAEEDQGRDFTHLLGLPANTVQQPPGLFVPFFIRQTASIPGPTGILVRREAVRRVGGFEPFMDHDYEDQAFYAKICLAEPVYAADRVWDYYRQHPNSCVSITDRKGLPYKSRQVFLDWLSDYLVSKGMQNTRFWKDIQSQRRLFRYPALVQIETARKRAWNQVRGLGIRLARKTVPAVARQWLLARWKGQEFIPPAGWVRFGSLRRSAPMSRDWGYERGQPIDRYYIEKFLSTHAADVRGCVLEVGDNTYTQQFGNGRVTHSDVLFSEHGDPRATLIADLADAGQIPDNSYDCILMTQTLQFIYDVHKVLVTLHRILKPGGVVLVTVPGISQISRYDMDSWGQYWSFTSLSIRRLFEEAFLGRSVEVQRYGNVLAASAFLYGLATKELHSEELDHCDPDYEVILAIRAVKCETGKEE